MRAFPAAEGPFLDEAQIDAGADFEEDILTIE
jgi:hypothetical protein